MIVYKAVTEQEMFALLEWDFKQTPSETKEVMEFFLIRALAYCSRHCKIKRKLTTESMLPVYGGFSCLDYALVCNDHYTC